MIATMNEKGRQTKLLAAIAVLAMVVCALAVVMPADDTSATPGTPANGSVTVEAVEDLNTVLAGIGEEDNTYKDVSTIILTADITIPTALTISKDVTITSAEGENYTITLGARPTVSADVVFENVTIATTATGNQLFMLYKAHADGEAINLTFNNVVFDSTTNAKKILVESDINSADPTLNMNGCNASGVVITYSKTQATSVVNIENTAGLGLELFDQVSTGISIGNNIKSDSTFGAVTVEEGTVTIDADTTIVSLTTAADTNVNVNKALVVSSGTIAGDGTVTKTAADATVTDSEGAVIDIETAITDTNLVAAFEGNDEVTYSGTVSTTSGTPTNLVLPTDFTGKILNMPDISTASYLQISQGTAENIVATFSSFQATGLSFTDGSIRMNAETFQGEITASEIVVDLDGKLSDNVTLKAASYNYVVPSNGELDLNGKTLTIESGATLVAYGPIVDTATTAGKITNNGTLQFTTIDSDIVLDGTGVVQVADGFGVENTIRTDITLEDTDNYLRDNTVILEGATLTIGRNAVLDLMGKDLTVYGTIVLERGAKIISTDTATGNTANGGIILMSSGAIVNDSNGVIGTDKGITISSGEPAKSGLTPSVTVQGVSGLTIGLERTMENGNRVYVMNVSGDIARNTAVNEYSITLNDVTINAAMSISRDVDITILGNVVVDEDVTFAHNGGVMTITGTFVLMDGAVMSVNAQVDGTVTAQAGIVNDTTGLQNVPVTIEFDADNTADTGYVTGLSIAVDRVSYPNPNDSSKTVVEQRVYLSGDLGVSKIGDATEPAADMEVTGKAYIDGTLAIPEELTLTLGANSYFDVSQAGTLVIDDRESALNIDYYGAMYIVEATGENNSRTETTYYTSFATAMENIADAVEETVTISGKYSISGTYELTGQQTIVAATGEIENRIIVAEDGQITVGVDAEIADDAFYTIEGRVIVAEGVGYEPNATTKPIDEATGVTTHYIYAVMTTDEDYNVTYSGFKLAMDGAAAGQTITVVGDATYNGNLTVPAQVTVDVAQDITLTVLGNVTVETEGEIALNSGAALAVGKDNKTYTITVNGILDASEGATIRNANSAAVNLYSTGYTYVDALISGNGVTPNAGYYNDAGDMAYTSVANAIAYAQQNGLTQITAYGTFTETGAITTDDVDILINGKVTFGTITLDNAYIGIASGVSGAWYTADVSALYGEGDAAVTSTVSLDETTVTSTSRVTVNASGTDVNRFYISGIVGETAITAGTVEISNGADSTTMTVVLSDNNTLNIASGATLLVTEGQTLEMSNLSDDYFTNNGTVSVDGALELFSAVIGGTVNVNEGGSITVGDSTRTSVMTVVGDLNISEGATMTIYGTLQAGSTPELLGTGSEQTGTLSGTVTLNGNSVVVVYAGSSIAEAEFVDGTGTNVKSTAYSVNGIDLATVYTFGSVDIDVLDSALENMDDLNVTYVDTNNDDILDTPIITWYNGETPVSSTDDIGRYALLTTVIDYKEAQVTFSIGTGITLSVDGVIVNGYIFDNLSIGTHTVSASVNPGLSGDVTITFNGVAVTNGQIEITSEMLGETNVLSATGNLTQDSTVVIEGGNNGSDGMSLTDILLIVLVVLILVMAIIVALRLMRS